MKTAAPQSDVDLTRWPTVDTRLGKVVVPLPMAGEAPHGCKLGSRDECESCKKVRDAADRAARAEMFEQRMAVARAQPKVIEWEQ